MILAGDYLLEAPALDDPWAAKGANEGNRVIHSALLRAGVDVITDLNPAIFHQKFIVRDPGEPSGAVLTGSTNFTLTDTGMNPPGNSAKTGNNLNHIVVLHGKHATDQYLAEFNRLRSATFGSCTSATNRVRPSSAWPASASSRSSLRSRDPRWRS